jgi:hypothetical protein
MHKIGQYDVRMRRLALLELSGWAFLVGPVGIDEGESMPDRLELLRVERSSCRAWASCPRQPCSRAAGWRYRGRVRACRPKLAGRRADRRPGEGSRPAGLPQRNIDRELPGRLHRDRLRGRFWQSHLPDSITIMRGTVLWRAGVDGPYLRGLQPGEGELRRASDAGECHDGDEGEKGLKFANIFGESGPQMTTTSGPN